MSARYLRPGRFTRRVFNPVVAFFVRRGVNVAGAAQLTVAGRRTGEPRTTIVNVLTLDGRRYLVAPRGTTEWVRNVRAANGSGRIGAEDVVLTELADADKTPVLRAYVDRWRWEVGQFFKDLPKHPSDEDLRRIAPGFPAFEIEAVDRSATP